MDHAAEPLHGRADHRGVEGARGGNEDGRALPPAHGISDATLYNWRAKYGAMAASETARLRTLEEENRWLKKLRAEQMLDNAVLKDLPGKTDLACGSVFAAV